MNIITLLTQQSAKKLRTSSFSFTQMSHCDFCVSVTFACFLLNVRPVSVNQTNVIKWGGLKAFFFLSATKAFSVNTISAFVMTRWGQNHRTVLWIQSMYLSPFPNHNVLQSCFNTHFPQSPLSHLSLQPPTALPPPSLSPCLTLTVIHFWHLLSEPPPTCLPSLSHPLQLHVFLYSLYISVLLSACCVCVSSRTMWRTW